MVNYIGKTVSIITRQDSFRYEGIVHDMTSTTSNDGSITLVNVKNFGTEDRQSTFIPPKDDISPEITFQSADIKELIEINPIKGPFDRAKRLPDIQPTFENPNYPQFDFDSCQSRFSSDDREHKPFFPPFSNFRDHERDYNPNNAFRHFKHKRNNSNSFGSRFNLPYPKQRIDFMNPYFIQTNPYSSDYYPERNDPFSMLFEENQCDMICLNGVNYHKTFLKREFEQFLRYKFDKYNPSNYKMKKNTRYNYVSERNNDDFDFKSAYYNDNKHKKAQNESVLEDKSENNYVSDEKSPSKTVSNTYNKKNSFFDNISVDQRQSNNELDSRNQKNCDLETFGQTNKQNYNNFNNNNYNNNNNRFGRNQRRRGRGQNTSYYNNRGRGRGQSNYKRRGRGNHQSGYRDNRRNNNNRNYNNRNWQRNNNEDYNRHEMDTNKSEKDKQDQFSESHHSDNKTVDTKSEVKNEMIEFEEDEALGWNVDENTQSIDNFGSEGDEIVFGNESDMEISKRRSASESGNEVKDKNVEKASNLMSKMDINESKKDGNGSEDLENGTIVFETDVKN